jgi:hypothetical protein
LPPVFLDAGRIHCRRTDRCICGRYRGADHFSIFLTQQSGKEMPKPFMKRTIFSLLAAIFGLVFIYRLISEYGFVENETHH